MKYASNQGIPSIDKRISRRHLLSISPNSRTQSAGLTTTSAESHTRNDKLLRARLVDPDLCARTGKGDGDVSNDFRGTHELFDGIWMVEKVSVRVPKCHLEQLRSRAIHKGLVHPGDLFSS